MPNLVKLTSDCLRQGAVHASIALALVAFVMGWVELSRLECIVEDVEVQLGCVGLGYVDVRRMCQGILLTYELIDMMMRQTNRSTELHQAALHDMTHVDQQLKEEIDEATATHTCNRNWTNYKQQLLQLASIVIESDLTAPSSASWRDFPSMPSTSVFPRTGLFAQSHYKKKNCPSSCLQRHFIAVEETTAAGQCQHPPTISLPRALRWIYHEDNRLHVECKRSWLALRPASIWQSPVSLCTRSFDQPMVWTSSQYRCCNRFLRTGPFRPHAYAFAGTRSQITDSIHP